VFKGEDVTQLSPDRLAAIRNRDIGFVFQSYNLLARHTALENVEMPLVYAGVRRKERVRRARAALEAVGLAERSGHGPGELSGGEQQRVAIARALVGDPALILADEPTGALDSRTGTDILALFEALNAQGRTVIMITHDEAVARHARRIIRLQDGAIVDDREVRPAAAAAAPRLAELGSVHDLVGKLQDRRRALRANKMRSFSHHARHHRRRRLGDHNGGGGLGRPDPDRRADPHAGRQRA
jgi:putative ABC transport system ATP-binding protein